MGRSRNTDKCQKKRKGKKKVHKNKYEKDSKVDKVRTEWENNDGILINSRGERDYVKPRYDYLESEVFHQTYYSEYIGI